jgi:hypothetical protein
MPSQLDEFVRTRADHRCEYCQASEWLTGQRYHVDHILPRKLGGETVAANLCLACPACNAHKRDKTEGVDPATNEPMPLFNPRTQRWHDHFAWSEDGLEIIGLTSCGRATVTVLKFNRPLALSSRAVWISVNRHPPP